MSHGKQFTLFSHIGGPNGWKVAYILDELKLTYETKFLDFNKNEHKDPEHTKFNPNGRIPTLIDHHNNDFVLWESDAILLYIVDKYDKENRLTVTNAEEKHQIIQWLFFQSSDQGYVLDHPDLLTQCSTEHFNPYFGQFYWFSARHTERIPAAIARYRAETLRVFRVLENVLSKQEWLIGNKLTIADLSFIPWNHLALDYVLKQDKDFELERDLPALAKWHAKLMAIPSVMSAFEKRAKLLQNN